MEVPEILQYLKFNAGIFPRLAVNEAITRKEEITPALLQILKEAGNNFDQLVEQENYMAYIYAMYLLAQFREKKAYPLVFNFFSRPGTITLDVTGDVVTEDLGRILASVCDGETDLMEQLIENSEVNEFVRDAALCGMTALVANDIKNREEVLSYYKQLFQKKLEKEPSYVWNGLINRSRDLYPDVVQAEIKSAFANGLTDQSFMSYDYVERTIKVGKEKTLFDLQTNRSYQLIGNVAEEMSWWACFSRDSKKIGRNAPCLCGSGRKYKKCCGA